jgi:hypothetical protein
MDVSYIYGLVDPNNHTVRYVGQTKDLHVRSIGHINAAESGALPVHDWLRSLAPAAPVLILLEVVRRNRQVEVRPGQFRLLSSVIEAKWVKRFRRTALNVNAKICTAAYEDFANPPTLNPDFATEE